MHTIDTLTVESLAGETAYDKTVALVLKRDGFKPRLDIKDRWIEDEKGVLRMECYYGRGDTILSVFYVSDFEAIINFL